MRPSGSGWNAMPAGTASLFCFALLGCGASGKGLLHQARQRVNVGAQVEPSFMNWLARSVVVLEVDFVALEANKEERGFLSSPHAKRVAGHEIALRPDAKHVLVVQNGGSKLLCKSRALQGAAGGNLVP